MTNISLNELPNWSPWPARLLGLTDWKNSPRTIERVEDEYNQDKYAKCLAFYRDAGTERITPEDVKKFEFGELSRPLCVSSGNEVEILSVDETRQRYYSLLAETMRPVIEKAAVVVELGCGYGFNLWMLGALFPAVTFVGGEYSANAVQLAGELFKGVSRRITVNHFNFYDARYAFLEPHLSKGPIVIFTSHALEQLPSAAHMLDVLKSYQRDVIAVFHFEPVYGLYDDSLLGLMRRRYTQMNDYNQDLLSLLQAQPSVRIVHLEPNLFGLNPLNPTSIVQWEFAN